MVDGNNTPQRGKELATIIARIRCRACKNTLSVLMVCPKTGFAGSVMLDWTPVCRTVLSDLLVNRRKVKS